MLIVASPAFRNLRKDGFEPSTRQNTLGVDGEAVDDE